MPTRIELLASLQRLDQEINEKRREATEASRQLHALEATVAQRTAEAAQLRDALAEAKAQQAGVERELAEVEDRMKDRRMRLQRIRNEKELQAIKREIDGFKERIGQLEEQELAAIEETEDLGRKVAAAEETLLQGQRALEAERAALVARQSTLAKQIEQDSIERGELAASLDEDLRRRYEIILARRGGTAVVVVRDGTCQGCHMHVPPQLFNEILKGEKVFACPNCHRILFYEAASPETTG